MQLFDSHAHLDDEKFDGDRELLIEQIREARSDSINFCRL